MTDSPVQYRTAAHGSDTYLAATVRIVCGSSCNLHNTRAVHNGRMLAPGESAESPEIRAALRKGLAEHVANAIESDSWGDE